MRPEDFSPGNSIARRPSSIAPRMRFNEARGFLPRKQRRCASARRPTLLRRINEAGGFLPRKPWSFQHGDRQFSDASMRPEDFSPETHRRSCMTKYEDLIASMRPEDFSPGNS